LKAQSLSTVSLIEEQAISMLFQHAFEKWDPAAKTCSRGCHVSMEACELMGLLLESYLIRMIQINGGK
jgi:hypothetical protein